MTDEEDEDALDHSKLRTPCNGTFLLKTAEGVLHMHPPKAKASGVPS
jgi:hypothetical protein